MTEWGNSWKVKFNEKKTKAVLFSHLRKTIPVNLLMNGKKIDITPTFKYLGIIFDQKLSWREHVNHVSEKTTRWLMILKSAVSFKWGLSPWTIKTIYERAVQPMMNYGAIVWGKAINFGVNILKLRRPQRLAALMITGGLRTSPTNALLVLSGIQPIEHQLDELVAMQFSKLYASQRLRATLEPDMALDEHLVSGVHQTSMQHGLSVFARTGFNLNNIQPELIASEVDPTIGNSDSAICINNRETAEIKAREITAEDAAIFTDASKTDSSPVAYALVNSTGETISTTRLSNERSVFRGELAAIEDAIDHLSNTLPPETTGLIFTDSLSSLQALKDGERSKDLDIRRTNGKLRHTIAEGHTIQLHWVPAHIGVPLNEMADQAAKIAINDLQTTEKATQNWRRREIKEKLKELKSTAWQNDWQHGNTGRWCYNLLPRVSNERKLSTNKRRNQLILGHAPLNQYLERFHLAQDPRCPHCDDMETIQHFLTECPRSEHIRFLTFGIRNQPLQANELLLNTRYEETLRKLISLRF